MDSLVIECYIVWYKMIGCDVVWFGGMWCKCDVMWCGVVWLNVKYFNVWWYVRSKLDLTRLRPYLSTSHRIILHQSHNYYITSHHTTLRHFTSQHITSHHNTTHNIIPLHTMMWYVTQWSVIVILWCVFAMKCATLSHRTNTVIVMDPVKIPNHH